MELPLSVLTISIEILLKDVSFFYPLEAMVSLLLFFYHYPKFAFIYVPFAFIYVPFS